MSSLAFIESLLGYFLLNKKTLNYEITFDASNLASGIFYYQLVIGNNIKTKKMVVLK